MRKISNILPLTAIAFTMPLAALAQIEQTTAPQASGISRLSDFYSLVQAATSWLVVFGIIIGALFVIIGGIQYMTSGGNEDGIKGAKAKIIGGLIGIAIVLLAFSLVNVVASFFGAGPVVS